MVMESSTVTACGPLPLDIALGTAETRQNDRLLAYQQVGAVELGVDVNGEVELAHRGEAFLRVRQGDGEVAAEADENLGIPIEDSLHGSHGIMPMFGRRREIEALLDIGEHGGGGFFGNSDRAVALHVGMPAQRADAGPRLAKITAQQQQVCDLLNVRGAPCCAG